MAQLLCWIEQHPALAGWVQALVAALAIYFGIWSAARLQSREKKMERQAAADTALVIAYHATKLIREIAEQLCDREALFRITSGLETCDLGPIADVEHALTEIPLHELRNGELAEHILVLRSVVRHFRERVEKTLVQHRNMNSAQFGEFFGNMSAAYRTAREARVRIAKLVKQGSAA